MRCKKIYSSLIVALIVFTGMKAQQRTVVDAEGNGDFRTIQEALNSLSDSSVTTRRIFIKKGIYKEKIFITKHNVLLEGEDRDKTIVT